MSEVAFQKQSPTVEQSNIEKWLLDHEQKLRQYAHRLATRDNGGFFEEGDFFSAMCTKIFLQATQVPGFMEMRDAYILKAAWNEGLMMIRKQRQYEMSVKHTKRADFQKDGERFEVVEQKDQFSNIAGLPTDNPENAFALSEENETIRIAIASLPEKSRMVCQMLYAGQRPVEIARQMGFKSRATINYHIDRIREVFSAFELQGI